MLADGSASGKLKKFLTIAHFSTAEFIGHIIDMY